MTNLPQPDSPQVAGADLRVLHAASLARSGGWLAGALASEGVRASAIDETVGVTATLARLREASYDAVVVSHEPEVFNAVELVEAMRIAGHGEAVVVLVDAPDAELELLCHESGADAVCAVGHATARSLIACLERAVRWRQVLRDNAQLREAERQRLAAEHRDAEQTLNDQRRLVEQLEGIARGESGVASTTPYSVSLDSAIESVGEVAAEFSQPYRDLLRAYVVMGAGNLGNELSGLAELLVAARVSAEQVVQMHLLAVEQLLGGLGRRSARHVMNRADLLVLELVAKLADGYRRRYHERTEAPRQQILPGFDVAIPQPAYASPEGEPPRRPVDEPHAA